MTSPQPVQMSKRGVLHLYPAFEPCNVDDATDVWIILGGAVVARENTRYRRDCRRCQRRLEEN